MKYTSDFITGCGYLNLTSSSGLKAGDAGTKNNFGFNIKYITNPSSPVSLGGNSTLQVSMTDVGDPGTTDKIGIVVFNNAGGVWLASNWDGTKTVQQTLAGGNLIVHSSSNVGSTSTARTEAVATDPAQCGIGQSIRMSISIGVDL